MPLSVLAVAAGLGMVAWGPKNDANPAVAPEAPAITAAAVAPSNSASTTVSMPRAVLPLAPSASVAPTERPNLQVLQAAVRDSNPYAAFASLLAAKRPGSYAQAWWLTEVCRMAITPVLLRELSKDTEAVSSPDQLHAAQVIKSRCEAWRHIAHMVMPISGDVEGAAFREALDRLSSWAWPFQHQEWNVVAQHGALFLVDRYLFARPDGPPRFFEGQRIETDPASLVVYNAALSLASRTAVMGAGPSTGSLHALYFCVTVGACDGGIPEPTALANLPDADAHRQQMLTLSQRMLAAILQGRVDAFAPPR